MLNSRKAENKIHMYTSLWLKRNSPSLSGKVVAISGSTGGLGNALCRHFASLGASLIMLDRNKERSEAFAKKLKAEFPELNTSYISLDLEEPESVIRAAETLEKDVPDYLILNAGAYHIPRKTCKTGYNNVFQINFSSPYYLAERLRKLIAAKGGRTVAVGSIAHGYSKADPSDIDFSQRKKSSLVYGNAKRYLMYSLSEWHDSSVRIAHPGITFTNITAHYPKLIFAIIKHPMKIIFMSPKKASLSVIYAMNKKIPDESWIGPWLFGIWGRPKVARLKKLSDKERELILSAAEKNTSAIENS